MNKMLVDPYKYVILLNPDSKLKTGLFAVRYKEGGKIHVQLMKDNFVEVYYLNKVTRQELLEVFEESDNIIGIRGEFKDEDTAKD
jgi:hypothetical protein